MDAKKTNIRMEKTAAEAYRNRARDCRALLDLIGQELEGHEERFRADEKNWAKVGDLGHVREELRGVLVFLSGFEESAIDEVLEDLRSDGGK